jgi:hypothetical protein
LKPDPRFQNQPKHFWANVRSISQEIGYTARGKKIIKVPNPAEIQNAFKRIGLSFDHITTGGELTDFGKNLLDYFSYRADVLNTFVEPRLMNTEQAKQLFDELHGKLQPKCPIPMNKQKGEKKSPAYLTGIINMLIEASAPGYSCDFDPRTLTTVTRDGYPVRTLARRVDGAFPSSVNPIAVWEIKEYYYTTTFGSRVADGVYETLLDGMELEELSEHERVHLEHLLMVDAHYTWWDCGRSYLCRIIDMLHMGYVDEVLFGREVVERLPAIVRGWIKRLKAKQVR